jgi:hypothetical protein
MYTTNTQSRESQMTHANRTKEIAKLLEVSKQMERIATKDDAFLVNPQFEKLAAAYGEQLHVVVQLVHKLNRTRADLQKCKTFKAGRCNKRSALGRPI